VHGPAAAFPKSIKTALSPLLAYSPLQSFSNTSHA